MTFPLPRIAGGYILLARKTLESELMEKPPHYLKLWVWMMMKANWKDRDKLKRGQLLMSIAEMQEAGGYRVGFRLRKLTKDEVRSAYEAFVKATMVTTAKTTRGMIITICNYELYQDPKSYEAHDVPHTEDAMKPTGTPHDTEEREERKKEKRTSSPESLRLSGLLADLILSNNPANRDLNNGKREASVKRWAADIDKLLRLDDQSPEMVEVVIRWCQADNFWQGNILSGSTLRKQWDKLSVKIQGSDKSEFKGTHRPGTFDGVL